MARTKGSDFSIPVIRLLVFMGDQTVPMSCEEVESQLHIQANKIAREGRSLFWAIDLPCNRSLYRYLNFLAKDGYLAKIVTKYRPKRQYQYCITKKGREFLATKGQGLFEPLVVTSTGTAEEVQAAA